MPRRRNVPNSSSTNQRQRSQETFTDVSRGRFFLHLLSTFSPRLGSIEKFNKRQTIRPRKSVPGARRRRVRARATVEIPVRDRISDLRHPDPWLRTSMGGGTSAWRPASCAKCESRLPSSGDKKKDTNPHANPVAIPPTFAPDLRPDRPHPAGTCSWRRRDTGMSSPGPTTASTSPSTT